MSLSPNTVIIIADIEKKDYIFLIFYDSWAEYFVVLFCPACGAEDRFKRHARYTKYYYSKELWILRLKCEVCGTTHAVIPSFSLPGTSIGAKEAEEYLIKRAEGVGRGVAGKVLLQVGLSEKYPLQIDKMFQTSVNQAKALFPQEGDPTLNGMQWVRSVISEPERPLYSLNCFCLEHGVNAVCCTRSFIQTFRVWKAGRIISQNVGLPRRRM
jgi:hypothetical protein